MFNSQRTSIIGMVALVGMYICHSAPAVAYSYCPSGYSCPSGTCAEAGADCCGRYGSNTYCKRGNRCHPEGDGCCPDDTIPVKGGCLKKSSDRVCGDGSYCDPGYACIAGNKCLSASSERYCGGGRSCKPGFACTGDGKCRSTTPVAPPPPLFGDSDDSSGDVDAMQCVSVEGGSGTMYRIVNSCTYGVHIVLETMDFSPRKLTRDSYYIGATSDISAISYFDSEPTVISACGRGSAGCN
jgi:hypothetical protein